MPPEIPVWAAPAAPVSWPFRSLLFAPAHKERMVEKAMASEADAVILDLEDSVPAESKAEGRTAVATIGSRTSGAVVIRTNAADSGELEADLEVVVREPVTALLLSKVRGTTDVRAIAEVIAQRELAAMLPAGHIRLIVTIETARSLIEVGDVLDSSEQIGGVALGVAEGGDLQRDLGTMWTPDGEAMLFARSHVVSHARARGIRNIIEGPYVRHADDDGLRAEAERARRLGFTGKAAIHPRQVPIINAAFSPSEEELDYHRRVVAAMEAAIASGAGAATVDGRMVDLAMLELARAALSGPWARAGGDGS